MLSSIYLIIRRGTTYYNMYGGVAVQNYSKSKLGSTSPLSCDTSYCLLSDGGG